MLRNLLPKGQDVPWIRYVILFATLLLALSLRLWGAFFDLPYIYHPDEPANINVIQAIYTTANLNPHYFHYPTLFFYLNALAACCYFGVPALISGHPSLLAPPVNLVMGTTYAINQDAVVLYRSLTICVGVLSVFLCYLVGSRGNRARVGVMAAVLMAISPVLVADCRHITPDSYIIVFELLTILASISIATSGRWGWYAAAGAAVGAAAATKYNGVLVAFCVITAHFFRFGVTPKEWGRLIFAGATSALIFLACSPFVLLDYNAFVTDMTREFQHYSGEHAGMDGNVPTWYLSELWTATGVAAILSVVQIALFVRKRDPAALVLAGFAIPYLIFISTFGVRNDRTLLPVIPCVLLLAAMFMADFSSWLQTIGHRISPVLRWALLAALGVALTFSPLRVVLQQTSLLTTVDSRATSREWISSQLPANSVVAIESYAPFVDPSRFRLVRLERAIDPEVEWYFDQGVDYVVLSQGMFGRYFENPQKYFREIGAYFRLMNSLTLVKRFADGNYLVYIYGTHGAADKEKIN
jgi:4-amino-4-deoxy-L-arabinose transferase-like glycosyltransferase